MSSIWIKLGLILAIISSISIQSEPAVSSIDLGSEWMKVAVVNLKPGQIPISIAINEMSKRKSPSLVAFHDGNRLIGEEAAGITARYPNKVFSQARDLVGKPYSYAKELAEALYLPFDLVEDKRGAVGVRADDGVVYSAEELAAMVLSHGKSLAEFHAKTVVKDAVITVPAYFGQAERKGLVQAAELAGINVLSLMNEHSGAALQYGIDKDFTNQSRYVIFYDMGASSTYAALVYFSAYNTKEYGKTVPANQFQVKDVRWNPKLGGQNMELRLVEYFADEFNNQVGGGVDVRKFPKAMAKLKKQVKRTKEILSANTMAPISVESLYDDRDFRSTITREKFEELCGDLWEQSLAPVKEVITHSGLKLEDIYAVELIGGATRVPKLQAKLQEFLGRKELDKHIDADEAIVLGAALHAANLSDGIKLNRKLGMIDGSPYGFSIELDGLGISDGESTKQLLVPRMKKLPSKMFRSIKHDKDFEVSLFYESAEMLPPGVASDKFAQFAISGLTDTAEKYSSRNISAPIKATLHFSLSRGGILSLTKADASIEISEWVEVPKKNLTVDNSSNVTPNISAEATSGNSSEGSSESATVDASTNDATTNTSKSDEAEQNTLDSVVEKKLKKRTFRVALKVVEKALGAGVPLSEESFSEAKLRLDALDKKDAERRKTAELKNNLESYIYATREKLESSPEIERVSTEKERQSFIEKLDEVQDWLYLDGEDASASEFQERLDFLKATGDPIFFRLSEITARPEAVEQAQKYLSGIQQVTSGWEKNKPWLPKERIDEVSNDADKVKKWIDEKEAEQKKTSVFSKPAFTSEEVYDKVADLQDKVASVNRIPKPKPKIEKPSKKPNETESKEDETDASKPTSEEDTSESDNQQDPPVDSSSDNKDESTASHDEL